MHQPVLTAGDNSESSEGSKNALLIQPTTFSVKPEEGNLYRFRPMVCWNNVPSMNFTLERDFLDVE